VKKIKMIYDLLFSKTRTFHKYSSLPRFKKKFYLINKKTFKQMVIYCKLLNSQLLEWVFSNKYPAIVDEENQIFTDGAMVFYSFFVSP